MEPREWSLLPYMKERTGNFRSEILRIEVDWEATWAEQADRFNVLGSKACSVCYGGKESARLWICSSKPPDVQNPIETIDN